MTLSHDVAGSGPAVILLHSTVCDRRMWDAQVPALVGAGYQVVRCDFRGFGASPMPDRPYNNAEDVLALLDTLGIERTALIASSGGGRVALEIAARRPERVTALALLCTALAGHEPSADLMAFGDREDALIEAGDIAGATDLNVDAWVGPDADSATRELVRRMQRNAFDVQLAAEEEFGQVKVETDPATIKAPALLVSGDHDFADFRAIAVHLTGVLADARHLELPWAGHLPNLERPDEVNALLVDFLNRTSS
ncbi:alpha/beta hydrolase [Streptomyces sp. ERV7]|uniref:alpha/beta fold hydrolase n=1 Tax=Streptomyces sp. ERV7 TaxID=1322334 RepID=UPI0007F50CE9|nr:alpha/beta hydrolase [Streptomyces sp. ERV7]OAR22748.1 alpha/beta hydrolase [Streptomyces sp. ERV7]